MMKQLASKLLKLKAYFQDKILKEFEKISKSLTEAKEQSIRIDSEASGLPGYKLAAERLRTPKAQPLEKELGIFDL